MDEGFLADGVLELLERVRQASSTTIRLWSGLKLQSLVSRQYLGRGMERRSQKRMEELTSSGRLVVRGATGQRLKPAGQVSGSEAIWEFRKQQPRYCIVVKRYSGIRLRTSCRLIFNLERLFRIIKVCSGWERIGTGECMVCSGKLVAAASGRYKYRCPATDIINRGGWSSPPTASERQLAP